MNHVRVSAAALVLCALLASCSVTHHKPLSPALFPAQAAAAAKDAAAVALDVADRERSFTSAELSQFKMQIEMPIGCVVEAAGLLALGAEFERAFEAKPSDDPRALHLRVDGTTADVNSRLVYFVPVLGGISRVDVKTQLAFEVQLLAADGRVRWSQRYDSGQELLALRRKGLFPDETVDNGVQRAIHEQAARLMRQVARDLRAWLDQERRRERVL